MAWYRGARRPLDEAEKSTDAAKARARAMELLAGQELSSGGLYERLNRRFAGQTAAAVVAEMVEREYVNDARYAETRAHGLLAAKKSRRAGGQPLPQKTGSRTPRPRGGRSDAPGLCLPGHPGRDPARGTGITACLHGRFVSHTVPERPFGRTPEP